MFRVKRPLEKLSPSNGPIYLYLLMILGTYGALVCFVYPYIPFAREWFGFLTILLTTQFFLMAKTICTPPG